MIALLPGWYYDSFLVTPELEMGLDTFSQQTGYSCRQSLYEKQVFLPDRGASSVT